MVKVTSLLILMIGISGYQTRFIDTALPCPPRPLLEPLTDEELDELSADVFEKVAGNQIELKGYAKKLEKRARCDKEAD